MTPPGDAREIAFWLDAATLTIVDFDTAERAGDAQRLRDIFKTLVSVSGQYEPWNDQRAADTFAQLNERLRKQAAPEQLRQAYKQSPNSPLWATGGYAELIRATGVDLGMG